ncbi:MAG: carboxylating nicotinate-nucleotide diphosphorylase [Smithellaceae bacterium]|nr:carboxylating nicotinate-nucleotide diphosphorylase [Smithellaceae bacterium]
MRHKHLLKDLLLSALAEDLGPGDVTTESIVGEKETGCAEAVAKSEMVAAGLFLFEEAFLCLDPFMDVQCHVNDGDLVQPGAVLVRLEGNLRAILSAERVALNFLQRLSGIATLTRSYVQAVAGTGVWILDTRKTTPGLRSLEKYAVTAGGGYNHRYGLQDGVLIKDNHIWAAGGIKEAVRRARRAAHHLLKIEVEVKNIAELEEALAAGAAVIMLDNMTIDQMTEAVALVAGRVPLEASGNVTLANVSAIAATGVNFISVGALTHSAPAADISLRLKGGEGQMSRLT